MKRNTIYPSSLLALLLALAACTQDDAGLLPEGAENTPVVFTATGLTSAAASPASRATVDGDWLNVRTVAVKAGNEIKEYDVNASSADEYASAVLSSSGSPIYWKGKQELTVSAWWPYDKDNLVTIPPVVVQKDQSSLENFQNSDFIIADNQTVTPDNPLLRFSHRTALVRFVLTDYTDDGLKDVILFGLSSMNGNPTSIVSLPTDNNTYLALVPPQSIPQNQMMLLCTFDHGSFYYMLQSIPEWKAGEIYTYTVSLKGANPNNP